MNGSLSLGLRKVIESGDGVLFLGAGIGFSAHDKDGNAMPDADNLARRLAEHFKIDATEPFDLPKIAQVVDLRHGRSELLTFLSGRLKGFEPDDCLQWLLGLTWRAIFTTNYDRIIVRAYELLKAPTQRPVVISSTAGLRRFDPRFDVPIYHLHGALFDVEAPALLITEQDYVRFDERRRMLFEILKHELAISPILYVGYSNNDPNWKVVRDEIAREFSPSPMPRSYRVAPGTSSLDREILESQNIETVDATLDEFVRTASSVLGEIRVEPHKLDVIREQVPSDLRPRFDANPAPTLRLLNSWTYVNQATFGATPNTAAFLRGEHPNWALVGADIDFARDIEEDVYDALLEYATALKARAATVLLLGPAGYGVSTALMSIAALLIQENAGPVFMHRPGTPIAEGDIEYACSLFASRPFFFIEPIPKPDSWCLL